KPAATSVPGISIAEHLPKLGKIAQRYAIIRSVNHRDNDHAIGAYLALTGHSHPKNAILGIEPPASAQDLPAIGSVVAKLRPAQPRRRHAARLSTSFVTGDPRCFRVGERATAAARCLRPDAVRPELPAGPANGRSGRAAGHALLGWQPRLGHARPQLPQPERHPAAADGPGRVSAFE